MEIHGHFVSAISDSQPREQRDSFCYVRRLKQLFNCSGPSSESWHVIAGIAPLQQFNKVGVGEWWPFLQRSFLTDAVVVRDVGTSQL